MDRREFLRIGAGTAAGFAACSGNLFAATSKRPNLLIIHTDEHNFRTLGCYRDTLPPDQAFMWGKDNIVKTPNIDSLAKNGALCTKFYATTPVCSPSRAAFVSGRYPQNTPVVTNNISMSDEVVTFASILGKAGYATGYAGKWHLDGGGKPQWEPKRKFGFQDNRYMFNRGHWKQFEQTAEGPRVKARKGGKPTYDVGGANGKSFSTDWLADRTIEFINEHKDKPFCFMVSIPDPHGPDSVRAPYDTMYSNQKFKMPRTASKSKEGVPSWAMPKENHNRGMDKYEGMVKCIDDNVGKILKALRKDGLVDNTIVIFTSDHGDLRGEHGRQNKGVPLEASAKVAFLLQYPGKVKPGTIVHEALGCVDFLPTILNLMGVKTAGKEQGRDASTLFLGRKPADWEDITFIRGTGNSNWVGAVTKRYKFLVSPKDEPWLIDMDKDPDELTNFCFNPEYRGVVRSLATKLAGYHAKYKDPSLDTPRAKYDVAWATGQSPTYDADHAPQAPAAKGGGKKGGKKKGKKKK